MTADEREVFKAVLFWAEAFQRHARRLSSGLSTPSLDEDVARGRSLLEVNSDDA